MGSGGGWILALAVVTTLPLVARVRSRWRLRRLTEFFRLAPKAELHLHLEGTLEIELANQLAAEKSMEFSNKPFVFTCLGDFLDEYFRVS